MNSQIFTLRELASYLHCHPSTIYRLVKAKKIPGTFKLGSNWRFDAVQVKAWIARIGTGAATAGREDI